MLSAINFDNHVKQMISTMRGAQRILFVGTGIKIENYPALAHAKWKCIYTTNMSEKFADAFNQMDRQVRPIYTKLDYDRAERKLDQSNPLLVFINGAHIDKADEEDIDAEIESQENRKLLFSTITSLLSSNLMVELVVVGYDPRNESELSPCELYKEMRLLPDKCVTFYGVNEELEADRYISALVEKGIVTLFSQNLGAAMESTQDTFFDDDACDDQTTICPENAQNIVYINGNAVTLDPSLCYDFNKYGRVLSVQEMTTGTINRMLQTEFFYQFLKRSPNAPQWYGYAKRNAFVVKRDFEEELYQKVDESLSQNGDFPIALVGQTSSGKSVALAALAFRVFYERKYPVLFVNNPDVTFAANSPSARALDNILKEIRDQGGRTLVILDWSIYNPQRNDLISKISYRFHNRGHNVLFVGSTMNDASATSTLIPVHASSNLTELEKKKFKELIVEKGKLPRNKVEKWMVKYSHEAGLLSMLYRLVYELHPQLELGLKKEITKALQDTTEDIWSLEDPIPVQKPLTAIAAQLLKLGLIEVSEKTSPNDVIAMKQQIIDNLQMFSEGLAVASLFKLRMPITMAMHILQIPEFSNCQKYRDVVFHAPWIHYATDNDEYAPGSYYVSFRGPVDARIYLNSINKTESAIMQIVASIIRTVIPQKDSFYSEEIQFLERLIRMVGPNSDDPLVRQNWYNTYGTGCGAVIDALSALRRAGIIEPELVAQEITYMREYYGSDYQEDLEEKVESLKNAIQIARDILDMADHPDVHSECWDSGLIDAITVENIFAELQLKRCYQQLKPDKNLNNHQDLIIQSYAQRSQVLRRIIQSQPENSYAYVALLACFISEYANTSPTPEMLADMSAVVEILDVTESSIPQVETNEHYQHKKTEFLQILDSIRGCDRMQQYFDKLLSMGSAVGVHIQAKLILRKAGVDFSKELDARSKAACQNALKLLEDVKYEKVVRNHPASQYMRLNLTWLCYNEKPLFEHERQQTHLTQEQWGHLYTICNEFKNNIIEHQPECPYRASVYYIMALSCAQLQQYEQAVEIWRSVQEEDFFSLGRQYTWHILCNSEGEPLLFTGTFNRQYRLQERRIYIKELQRPVLYPSLQSINKSDTTGEAPNLCIGTSYRGFSAFSLKWKRRDR